MNEAQTKTEFKAFTLRRARFESSLVVDAIILNAQSKRMRKNRAGKASFTKVFRMSFSSRFTNSASKRQASALSIAVTCRDSSFKSVNEHAQHLQSTLYERILVRSTVRGCQLSTVGRDACAAQATSTARPPHATNTQTTERSTQQKLEKKLQQVT